MRRNVKISNQHARHAILGNLSIVTTKAFHKIELVRELVVGVGVRHIPARWQVDVV